MPDSERPGAQAAQPAEPQFDWARWEAETGASALEPPSLPPQHLTSELVSWLIAALEAVLKTPEAKLGPRRAYTALVDALKMVDDLPTVTP